VLCESRNCKYEAVRIATAELCELCFAGQDRLLEAS
jgi:hypothetical protein